MKKHHRILAALAAAVMLAMQGTALSAAAEEPSSGYTEDEPYYVGDASNNGTIDVADIIILQQYLHRMTFSKKSRPYRCDLNHDGSIDVFDLSLLKRTVLGTRDAEFISNITYTPLSADVAGAQYADITLSGTANALAFFNVSYEKNGQPVTEEFYAIIGTDGSYAGRYTVPEGVNRITVSITSSYRYDQINQTDVMQPCEVTSILALYPPPTEQPTDEPTEPPTEVPTEPPTDPPSDAYFPPTVDKFGNWTPSTGDCKMLTIFVDFADVKYLRPLSAERMRDELYGRGTTDAPYESLTTWYNRASYGNLHIEGDCYYYTCKGNMSDYMNNDRLFETFAMEALSGLDAQINYADYDADKDGVIDCIALTVPLDNADAATKQYWWGCTATWWENPGYRLDGMEITKYMIIDQPPYENTLQALKSELLHEMGHSIGLPDYYLYDAGDDWENFHGSAGFERMDDSIGDFNSFSKLMYGWLRENEVQWYNGSGEQTFTIQDATQQGSCLILPITAAPGNITSEYFLVEYVTQAGNNYDMRWWTRDSGVRIYHIQADLFTDYWRRTNFRYEGFGENYMGNDKIRVLRLVNDNGGFYHTGDTCTFGTTNFAAYDANGYQTINTGYTVKIGELTENGYTITVSK